MKKWNWKSIILVVFLLLVLIVVIYSLIGISVTGPYYLGQKDRNEVISKIEKSEKDVKSITRHSFEFITYTCETDDEYIIYNENGEKILTRDKKDLQLEEVEKIINKDYPALANQKIQLSYGYENAVYLIEDDNYTMLMLDFDELKEVFYMKEGE